MPSFQATDTITVALLGNPNTGKSTLFSALCGVRQRVGNYPGVTVEKKIGHTVIAGRRYALVDLPGTYSLAPRSPDEMVAVEVLLGRRSDVAPPDVVLCIVDASNLERNLYLVSQTLELGRPIVIALNMMDVAAEKGIALDIERLGARLGVPVIPVQAHRKLGLRELKHALDQATGVPPTAVESPFPAAFQQEVAALERGLARRLATPLPRYLIERLVLDAGGYLEHAKPPIVDAGTLAEVQTARGRLAAAGCPIPAVEAISRYGWVSRVLDGAVARPRERKTTLSDRIDKVLTHRFWGTLVFAVLMVLVFQSIFAWAAPVMEWLDRSVSWLGEHVAAALPAGALRSLLVDGVIAGAGGVVVFLPQILILFFFIAVLEDCGYMARAAYLMDKLMSRIGLSGKSFIPLLSSFACAIPGIMATRVIENRRDRLVTVLIAPLMSCSARLPVYALLIAAFIPDRRYFGGWLRLQSITMFAMYLVGIVAAILVALALKRTLLKGETPPFVMELPGYKFPAPRTVVWRMLESGWSFLRRAGTLIVAVSVVVWAAAYFPHDPQIERQIRSRYEAEGIRVSERRGHVAGSGHKVSNEVAAAYLEQSWLGRAGRLVEPVVRPLGWDWRIGCAVIASFPAREIVISTLGVVYRLGAEQDESSESLRETLCSATWPGTDRPVFNVPVALSIMVFFALCAQCAATLAVIRRETNSWRWPAFTFVYMTTLAYVGALATYQIGMLLQGGR